MYPKYDGDMKFGFTNGRTTFNTNFEAGFDENRRVIFDQTANYVWNRKAKTVDGKLSFKLPSNVSQKQRLNQFSFLTIHSNLK